MRSEVLSGELAGLIRRLQNRIEGEQQYAHLLSTDSKDQSLQHVLRGIEDAIAGLVVLHIQLRRDHQ